MLLFIGKWASRLLIAGGVSIFAWAIGSFLISGIWHPITLAEVLAFYRVPVPDFGLNGLKVIYPIAGSIWLSAWTLLFGLIIGLASAKFAPDSTGHYFRRVLLMPFTFVEATIKGFFAVVSTFIKYSFLLVMVVCVMVCAWWSLNYILFARKFSGGDICKQQQNMFGDVRPDFAYDCIEIGGSSLNDEKLYYVLFMASNDNPNASNTGHAWLATSALKRAADDSFLLTDYEVTGYGPPPNATGAECYPLLTRAYLVLRPAFPFAAPIEQYWCLRGVVGNEGRPPLHNAAGQAVPKPPNAAAMNAMLGANPAVVLAVNVSQNQYEIVRHIVDNQIKAAPNYQLGLNDCTTFVRDIAEAIGLYVPPRILSPFPSESIYKIREYNIKQNGLSTGRSN